MAYLVLLFPICQRFIVNNTAAGVEDRFVFALAFKPPYM